MAKVTNAHKLKVDRIQVRNVRKQPIHVTHWTGVVSP